MKAKNERNSRKAEAVSPAELTSNELKQVSGGSNPGIDSSSGISCEPGENKPGIVMPERADLPIKDPEGAKRDPAGGGAGIHVPEGSSLIIVGEGKLEY